MSQSQDRLTYHVGEKAPPEIQAIIERLRNRAGWWEGDENAAKVLGEFRERELTASRADAERLAECLRNVRPATLNCGTIDRQFWTGPSETTEIIDAALAEHEKDL